MKRIPDRFVQLVGEIAGLKSLARICKELNFPLAKNPPEDIAESKRRWAELYKLAGANKRQRAKLREFIHKLSLRDDLYKP